MPRGLLQLAAPPANAHGRFAPSPTGTLHLGNLRTALVAWCCARSQGAEFSLRIEDLDRDRVRPGSEAKQLADLEAIGIDWDGPILRQSERTTVYEGAIEVLRDQGLVYECWCTRSEIRDAASAPHAAAGTYPGTCRRLSSREIAERRQAGRPAALRVSAEAAEVEFFDRVHGATAGTVDDFVIARRDGTASYNLAVTVDDAAQRIGEIVRGDDLLDATPAQRWLQQKLGYDEPTYTHLPLVRDADGKRSSKRDASTTLDGQSALGIPPDRVRTSLLASLGLCDDGEQLSSAALLSRFRSIVVESPE
ncbi:MAG: tRNA glutamyl-Q(34) synthetase GluQRS [Actinobacteria bacterium]|uniref:Unannotated protein n=1 Tax=freshwater metagenome TaxID=449393 RepID=A0A6J5ZCS0_9ZZZZ|nr:tRNA glutamyl-Q(34) synthetase GluQRS [Actinomycetota bacterium]